MMQYFDAYRQVDKGILRRNHRGAEDRTQRGVEEVVQLERLTSELTTPTKVKK